MSLRYRLFLWVSGLFLVVSICSYFVENYVANTQLNRAQQALRKKLLGISEGRRIDLQNFLASAIAEDEVRIDAILNNISSFSPLALRFGPTSHNEKMGTWGDVSDILLEYKWLDFIQNTNQGVTTAGLMPRSSAMGTFYRSQIDEDLSWVYVEDFEGNPTPYLGVRLPYSLVRDSSWDVTSEVLEHVPGMVPDLFCLFDVNHLVSASSLSRQRIFETDSKKAIAPVPVQWTEGYELDLDLFVRAFQRGREGLLTGKIYPPQCALSELRESFERAASMQKGRLNPIPAQNLLASVSTEQLMKKRFEDIALRYTQINMIWILIALFDSGIFGDELFTYPFPGAATVFGSTNAIGVGIDTAQVLFEKRIFDDAAYYEKNASADLLGTSLAIITSPETKRVFFGNTGQLALKAADQVRTGYLTLGVDTDAILQKLALAIHQRAILVHGGQSLSAYSETGEKMSGVDLPIASLLKERLGLVAWGKENYFFMHIQPFPDVDLHFLVLNPEVKEFALLHDLEAGSQEIINSIRLNIHIEGLIALLIAILLLHNISRKITRPIIQLAHATGAIAEGHLDQIRLSLPVSTHNDEIAVLCHSFEEMVKGLQEKEKVKGVLNKVVSREIAQEILKGSIHLGGEEKTVTVLFADMRNFTQMTQNMPPQKVVDLLNTCMTKVSMMVDRNKGVIDKYVGDEVMALFGAPISRDEDAIGAIKSALEMIEVMREWNRERSHLGEPIVELGIGIHTGSMLAGNMGAENRLNYTVIGSNVNLAARLCQVAKGMEILMTKDTLDQPFVKERIVYEEISPLQLKGFDKAVDVFRVLHLRGP
jgi:class 3 adenylate cyclase